MDSKTVYIGLGSNLGDRRANLSEAQNLLKAGVEIVRASSIYETAPRDVLDQPVFFNQVIEAKTSLSPPKLLAHLLEIERTMGRERTQDKGPRIIDLDILLFADLIVATPNLQIPHPRMTERRFVLEPLGELAPDLPHPISRRTIRQLSADVGDQHVKKLFGNG